MKKHPTKIAIDRIFNMLIDNLRLGSNLPYITIPKGYLDKLDFKIEVSPFGDKVCCCGHINCVELDCYEYCNTRYEYLNNMTLQEYDEHDRRTFNAYENNA